MSTGASTATVPRPLRFAGVPLRAWAFGIRIWIAIVVALVAGFWLQLEAPSSAAVTVAILAAPTRGQALEKACYRLFATFVGVTAAIVMVGLFSQTRDLLLAAFAAWLGLCVYAASVLDGNRAYAAVLSGYTVAIVAIQQLDTPHQVFETAVARGAAIAVGIAAVALVNDLLATPDGHHRLGAQLTLLHHRVRDYAKSVLRDEATDAATAAGLLHDIAALHPELATVATESADGSARSAAARSTAVALVAELHAVRALDTLPVAADPSVRALMVSALDREGDDSPAATGWRRDDGATDSSSAVLDRALGELLRRDGEVRDGLAALQSGVQPHHAWRTPLHRSHAIAAAAGLRAAIYIALASVIFVLAGWPEAEVSLSLVAIVIGLGAITPSPQAFTLIALIASPIAVILAGILEFLILDGVTGFPLLAIALAPFVIGAAVLTTLPHRLLAALGRLNLIFILVILGPSNPQTYNPETYLFIALFLCAATALLLAAQTLVPPLSGERRQRWLMASARRELGQLLSGRDRRLAPEEAMFRDATRIGQILGAGPPHRATLEGALSCFDQAAAIRLAAAGGAGA